ncbi:MAG: bifunctional phosphoribosylaminoimidazolecarboxamide formyltransferase/IMP cyclohydrolase [Alphaproteobacteria bacterium]|nr:bifunctional phosphoribosylaminoimidazolecarboxamide formyltransferase/IMP cyclohydrolase [Alphaproteobacteria bacterium]
MADSKIARALISVSDKTGLVVFGKFLAEQGVRLLSTGGSARTLRDAGLAVTEVADHTDFPEMLDGRVKTLHPKIHGGILGRRDVDAHRMAMEAHDIAPIDLVVVNLYPFEETVARGANFEECVENIDIGGPALIRAAAKNHDFVTVVTDPSDYDDVMAEMKNGEGATTPDLRSRLAATAYARTAAYDANIAAWFEIQRGDVFPTRMAGSGILKQKLRYGENPHQEAALYLSGRTRPGVALASQIQGKELSYNNINDTDAAFELVSEFDVPAVAIIKHANPCGVAVGETPLEAYRLAHSCDPVSAFGGIVALNRPLDGDTARAISEIFVEVVIAPEAEADARAVFAEKKNLRLLLTGDMPDPDAVGMTMKTIAGGFLMQSRDNGRIGRDDLKFATKRKPTDREISDMLFAFKVCKHTKSNAIIYVRDGVTVGIGAGQMSRVDSSRTAAQKGKEHLGTERSVVASDAFFPFSDGLIAAIEAGATAVIQPGGSVRDEEVIAAADEAGIAMAFTGMRHFRH